MAKFESMEFNIFELVLINLDEFADLCNAIALRFQKEDVPSCFENLPSIYHSPFSEKLKAFIRSTKFGYMISIILIVNLVAVIVETTLDIQESSLQSVWQEVEFVFGWIYVLEMALKIYSYGFENYWRDGQNRFDFLVTWVIDAETVKLLNTSCPEYVHGPEVYHSVLTLLKVIAFVLEAFFAEMELESSEKCEEEDKDGEPRERRRRVGTKTRSQRVDVLLHHMLSAELQKSCDS
ncbi:Two pore calcium channel protein 1 [Citrus sinensis]|nr:Two pore calcium channel protein 1 [Citrus sinensis]